MLAKRAHVLRRMAIAAAALLLGATAVALLLPLALSSEAAKTRVASALSDWLGVSVSIGGDPRLRLFPDARLSLDDIRIASRDGYWRLEAPRLNAHLDLSSLLAGEITASSFELQSPRIEFAERQGGEADIPALSRLARHELKRLFRQRLKIVDGRIKGMAGAGEGEFSAVELSLDADRDGNNAVMRARFDIGRHPFDLRVTLGNTGILDASASGAVAVSLASPIVSLKLAGTAIAGDDRVSGTLEISTSDLRQLAREGGAELGHRASLGAARLSGEGTFGVGGIEFNRVRVDLDGNTGEGRLAFRPFAPRPMLEGTLAFERLDATAYLEDLNALLQMDQSRPADISTMLSAADIDLRLSAGAVDLGDFALGRTGLAFLLREDDLVVDVSEAELIGGSGRAHLRLTPAALPAHVLDLAAAFTALRIADLPRADARVLPTGGLASLSLDAKSSGETFSELARQVSGSLTAKIAEPSVSGLDFGAEVARLAAAAGADPAGRAAAAEPPHLELQAGFTRREMQIDRLSLSSAGYLVKAKGRLQFSDGNLALRAKASPLAAAQAAENREPAAAIPFLVRGTWREPKLLPDLKGVSLTSESAD